MKKQPTYYYILTAILVIAVVGVILAVATRSRTSRDGLGNARATAAPTATAYPTPSPTPTAAPSATPAPTASPAPTEDAPPTATPDSPILEITENGAEPAATATPAPTAAPQSTPAAAPDNDIITIVGDDVSDIDGSGLRLAEPSDTDEADDEKPFGILE